MYASRLSIRNWRNFTRAEVEFRETTYLIGPNASGKSNFLDIFRFMRDICKPHGGGLQQAVESRGGTSKVRSLAARKNPNVEFTFEFRESLRDRDGSPDWTYHISIGNEHAGRRRPLIQKETVIKGEDLLLDRPDSDDRRDPERLTQTHIEQLSMNSAFREIATFFEEVLYLHLVPQLLKYSDQLSLRRLESDPFGQGLLEEIAKLPPKVRDSRLRRIEEILLKLIPNLEQLSFVKDEVTGQPHLEMLYKHWRPNAGKQREDQFSDGTLRLMSMLWTLLTSNSVILLEEPELSLHEAVVGQIPKLIYRAHQTRKQVGSQILVSTHSASMLSDRSIDAKFLLLLPGEGGESTTICPPTEEDLAALGAGLSAADVLLPKTAVSVKSL